MRKMKPKTKKRFQSTPPVKAATVKAYFTYLRERFQSTPPVKAATFAVAVNYIFRWIISIHAAREGGDIKAVTV